MMEEAGTEMTEGTGTEMTEGTAAHGATKLTEDERKKNLVQAFFRSPSVDSVAPCAAVASVTFVPVLSVTSVPVHSVSAVASL
jgi:hypothetical protein